MDNQNVYSPNENNSKDPEETNVTPVSAANLIEPTQQVFTQEGYTSNKHAFIYTWISLVSFLAILFFNGLILFFSATTDAGTVLPWLLLVTAPVNILALAFLPFAFARDWASAIVNNNVPNRRAKFMSMVLPLQAIFGPVIISIIYWAFYNLDNFSGLRVLLVNNREIGYPLLITIIVFLGVIPVFTSLIISLKISKNATTTSVFSVKPFVVSFFAGVILLAGGLVFNFQSTLAARTELRDFTVYTEPTNIYSSSWDYRDIYRGIPSRLVVSKEQYYNQVRMNQMKTESKEARNAITGLCTPEPHEPTNVEYLDFKCELEFTSPKGIKVYKEDKTLTRYLVIDGTFIILSDSPNLNSFVDKLSPAK